MDNGNFSRWRNKKQEKNCLTNNYEETLHYFLLVYFWAWDATRCAMSNGFIYNHRSLRHKRERLTVMECRLSPRRTGGLFLYTYIHTHRRRIESITSTYRFSRCYYSTHFAPLFRCAHRGAREWVYVYIRADKKWVSGVRPPPLLFFFFTSPLWSTYHSCLGIRG